MGTKVASLRKYRYKEYLANMLPCVSYGVVCGAATGGLLFFFKFAAKLMESLSRGVYAAARESVWTVLLVFLGLVVLAVGMWLLHKRIPEVMGGGIPRSEGVLRGRLPFRWFRVLVGTFAGSMTSFLAGLPLGSEGPAVLMGTSIGRACSKLSKNREAWSRYIMTGGAGAGFAVATGAPLSGILFALEEVHKRFTPMLVLMVSVSTLSATYVNRLLCWAFGMQPGLFEFEPLAQLELGQVGYLLLLGVLVALAVGIFDWALDSFNRLSKRCAGVLKGPSKLIGVFLLTGVLGFVFTDALYSGHGIIELVAAEQTVRMLVLAVLVRFLMMLLVTDSGATGGIFIPTLAIGALVSALIGKLLLEMGLPAENYSTVVLLGMCAFLGGTLRAPLTASVLFLELTAQFEDFFCVALVVFTVNVITELLNQTPFFDRALEKMEHEQKQGKETVIACFQLKVSQGAFVVGKTVRDILWPASAVVLGVTRSNKTRQDLVKDGELKLYAGDTVVVRTRFYDEKEVKDLLAALVGTQYEIIRMEE